MTARAWRIAGSVVGALAILVAVAAAAYVVGRSGGDQRAPAPSPSPSTGASNPTQTPTVTVSRTAAVYYVGVTPKGPRLYREWHTVSAATTAGLPAAAVGAALGAPVDPDYQRWPWAFAVDSVRLDGAGSAAVITVALRSSGPVTEPSWVSAEYPRMYAEAVVRTAQAAFGSSAPVEIDVDGKAFNAALHATGDGPIAALPDADAFAHVWVDSPAEGATVKAGAMVTGLAAAFEAHLDWQLLQGTAVAARGSVQARECCTMAPFGFAIPDVPPGDYVLTVTEDDPSGGEGKGPDSDTKAIRIER